MRNIESELAGLVNRLSVIYNRTVKLTETLDAIGCKQASETAFEAEILLKNALRLLADAMSELGQ